jgi:hypothetical protein
MVISNKVLISLLVLAILSSALSVLVNLNALDSLYATSRVSDQGFISLDIPPRLSITTADGSFIDFGHCVLLNRVFNISSDGLKDTSESCKGYVVRNISARNNGNVLASVKIKSSVVGALHNGSFLQSPSNSSVIAYRISNSGRLSNKGGCLEGLGPSQYTSFAVVGEEYDVCEKLNFDSVGGNNSVVANFEIVVPFDVEIGFSEVVITFVADQFEE